MSEWDVARPTGRCVVSGRELAEDEEFYAVLFDRGGQFQRCDYALAHWQGPPDGAFCFWRSRVPRRHKKRRRLVDDEVLVDLFNRLAGHDEPIKIQFRFLLGLILLRKRLLKYEGTVRQADQEVWLMRPKGQDQPQRVINPQLGEEQIEQVSQQLGAILNEDVTALIASEP
jgi:hypothetical protein